ncbi:hypothetical protein JI59_19790 (plasmid) [Novosphingobium pentaromativorans US6-1]|uniref:HTH gntR-type domain-containing protein n=2 Tax=Novosphingobium pentaromativorans TaxID=205844 RepID=G6EFN6_9SPHN|nr:hypothetical protein JI59_19790 [Novosphingobium pentaromativorans US6-1]EHJ59907.1 hypothetical protein NSU_3157 [Novosphingobium pentaromativorans US6-1]
MDQGASETVDTEPTDLRARLRDDVISCVLAPGQRLKLDELRSCYNASVGSLREALTHMVFEGLVSAEANRGFCVAQISLSDLDDITEVRLDIERKALAQSIEHGDDQWEADIVAAYHMMVKVEAAVTSPTNRRIWVERHSRFHEALIAACPSNWLLRFRSLLFDQAQRYRTLSVRKSPAPGRIDEHRKLLEAVLERDTEKACEIIENHIRGTAENARKWLIENGMR